MIFYVARHVRDTFRESNLDEEEEEEALEKKFDKLSHLLHNICLLIGGSSFPHTRYKRMVWYGNGKVTKNPFPSLTLVVLPVFHFSPFYLVFM